MTTRSLSARRQPASALTVRYHRVPRLGWSGLIRGAFMAASRGERRRWSVLSVVISDDRELQRLNHKWMRLNSPTDVLSFELGDGRAGLEGEIYISTERVAEQAGRLGERPEREMLRLAVHGLLHLWGYDHNDRASLDAMVRRGERYVNIALENR